MNRIGIRAMNMKVLNHFLSRQFLNFVFVGGLAAFVHWLSRYILSFWISFGWAVTFAYFVGLLTAFFLNRSFVFKSSRQMKSQLIEFTVVNLCFFPVVWFASLKINDLLIVFGQMTYSHEIAHAIAISIPMFATFLIYKFFTFGEKI